MTSGPPIVTAGGTAGPSGLRALPVRAQVYITATIALGIAAMAWGGTLMSMSQPDLLVELVALAALTSTIKVALPLSRSVSTISFSSGITLLALLLLGPGDAVAIGVLSSWAQCTFRTRARNPTHQTLFSVASVAIAVLVAGLVFDWVRGSSKDVINGMVRPLGPAALVYFLANSVLVANAIAMTTRQSLRRVWMGSFMWSAPGYLVAAGGAAVAAMVAGQGQHAWGVLVAIPLYVTYRSYRAFIGRLEEERQQVRQLSDVQLATIEALALAIEAKDRTSREQIRRMQVYAEALARAAGMNDDDIRGVKTAALLHDVGNLAVPEHILGKTGTLSYEEFERVKIHPRVGSEILRGVPFPYPVADLILAHHERWDGTGYPHALSGQRIPVGARVLSIVDTFTAMLFERPYRDARSFGEAVATLRKCAGASLDPELVERFIEILPGLEVRLQTPQDEAGLTLVAGADEPMTTAALSDIAGAHHEAKVLYEIAQTLGSSLGVDDTVSLVASKLGGLLPFAGYALFLRDRATGRYTCRVANGAAEHDLRAVHASSMEELTALPVQTHGGPGLHSVLAAPLVTASGPLGALVVYDLHEHAYDNDHRRVLDLVARQSSAVIQNAVVFEETEEASLTDTLTSLANRRALQIHLDRALVQAEQLRRPVTVLLLDLDGLKYINDHFGHHAGDRAIREVGTALRSLVRDVDLASRYAGDEFVAVLWDCDERCGETRRQQVQNEIDHLTIDVGRGRTAGLGISAGCATFPKDGRTFDELLVAADGRMYEDKGRRKRAGTGRPGDTEPPLRIVG